MEQMVTAPADRTATAPVGPAVAGPDDGRLAFHRLLLRLSGRLPDELVTETRRWLADGELVEIAQAVVFAALTGRVALTDADAGLLRDALDGAGEQTDALAEIERSPVDPLPRYGLSPVSPEVLAEYGDAVPYSIDLTVPYHGPGAADEIDGAAVAALRALLAGGAPVTALWRAWRFPALDTQWPPPRRMYLLQGDDEAALPRLAAQAQDALESAGESAPQVEAFHDPDELPVYQRTALGFATLLWAATPAGRPRLAVPTTAQLTPTTAQLAPRLDGEERERVLAYLDAGTPLLITAVRTRDAVDPTLGEVVPTAYRTDGRWIWTDADAYHLRTHRLAPDPELLDAIRAHAYHPPEVDQVALHRALSMLYAPDPASASAPAAGAGAGAAPAGGATADAT